VRETDAFDIDRVDSGPLRIRVKQPSTPDRLPKAPSH